MASYKSRLAFAIAIAAATWSTATAKAQLVVGVLESTESLYYLDISGGFVVPTEILNLIDSGIAADGIYGVSVDNPNRTIYFYVGDAPLSQLYSVHYDDPELNFSGRLRARLVADNIRFVDNQILNGLGYDENTDTLYAVDDFQSTTGGGPEGIYTIDRTTGVTTLVVDLTTGSSADWQIRGIDFNPVDNLLYAINIDSTPNGQGLFSIDVNGAGTITPIATTSDTSLRGLAIGNDRAYMVSDNASSDIIVYNLVTASFETPISAVPWTTSELDAGAGYATNFPLSPIPGANFCSEISADVPNGADVEANGGVINFTITNANCGPDNATSGDYTITLSGSGAATATISNIISTSGTAVEGPTGTITGTVNPAPAFATETITFTVTSGSAGDLTVSGNWTANGATDPYLGNNTVSQSNTVRVFPAASAVASTVPFTGSALSPLGIAEYDGSLGRAYRSPDGTRIAFEASTNFDSGTNDDVVVRYDNGIGTLISQENNTVVESGIFVDNTDERMSVNNNGFVAFAVDATSSLDDDYIVYSDGTTLQFVCQEDDIVPNPEFAPNGWDYGSTQFSPNITGSNLLYFNVEFMGGGIPSSQNTAFFRSNSDGSAVDTVVWGGVTIPANQAGGATEAWEDGDTDLQWVDGAGCNYLVLGDLTGSTTSDEVLIVNGTVVLQEGETVTGTGLTGTIPGSFGTATTGGISHAEMMSNGDWFAVGITSVSDEDWIVKGNGTTFSLLARNGDEVAPGTGEFWSDVDGFSPTFRGVAGNNQGDYVIMGRTTELDTAKNMAIFLNGMHEVIREGDPVALDADGLFNDDAFVALDVSDEMILTDGGQVIFTTGLNNSAGTDIGDAIVSVDMSAVISAPLSGADLAVQKSASTDFIDNVGAQITYTITVCNVGPDDATNVVVTDTLPAQVSFVSGTNGAMEVMPGIVEANLGTITAYTSVTMQITVDTIAEGFAVNNVSVMATESDPIPGNNTAQAATTIENQVDVGVSKIDNGGSPVGQQYNYTVTVTNAGPADATNVLVRDDLPAEVSFVSSTVTDINPDPDLVDVVIANIPAGGMVTYDITVTATVTALAQNNLAVLSLDQVDTNPANDTFLLETLNGSFTDLEVRKFDSGLTNLGDDITYTIEVENLGPATATNVVVTDTLPAGVALVSVSEPFNTPMAGVVEVNYASILNGNVETITIVVTPATDGTFINNVSVTSDEADPDPANNDASVSSRVGNFRDMTIIFSEIDGHPTAVVPGARDAAGVPELTEFKAFDDLQVSPDGTNWGLTAFSEQTSSVDSFMLTGSGLVGDTLAQEGQQIPSEPVGHLYDFVLGNRFGFNSNNDLAFGAAAAGLGTDDLILTVVNGVQTTVARESDPAFGLQDDLGPFNGALLGNSMGSEQLLDNGDARFCASNITVIGSAYDSALMNNTGGISTAFEQVGISMVSGEVLSDLDGSDSMRSTPDGLTWTLLGNVGGDSTLDESLIVNGVVEIRGGGASFMGIPVDDVFNVELASNGSWFARVGAVSLDDLAVSDGVILAQTGDSVTGGAETWGDSFVAFNGNTLGDWVLAGVTSEPDENFNTVMVLNGETVIVREGDPIDLDGNGMFDDNVFIGRGTNTINPFGIDDAYLTDDGTLYFIASLRDGEGNDLGTFGSGGQAFLTMDLSDLLAGGCPTIAGDVDGDGDADGLDIQGATTCILSSGTMGGNCSCLDYDMSGVSDLGDIADFVNDLLN